MKTLKVDLGERHYDILIGADLIARAAEWITTVLPQPRVIVITDTHVATHHLPALLASLDAANIRHQHIIVPAGETSKSFASLEGLLEQLLTLNPERKTTLIALGGGVIGDLVGFAASILLRGVPFIQIPTTLLAQVDSSVGGKTGINSAHGKNLIGSFYQPKLVLADTQALTTLPDREMRSGYAEVVKYGLINDPEFFSWLEQNGAKALAKDEKSLTHIIHTSCAHKANIVSQDERESGVRALLNLGHTFGHALEAETGFSDILLHGEAVAMGMVMAFQLSAQLGLCPDIDLQRVVSHLRMAGLPTRASDRAVKWNIEAIYRHFAQDKKVENGKLTFILTKGIGKSFISQAVDKADLVKMLEAWKQI